MKKKVNYFTKGRVCLETPHRSGQDTIVATRGRQTELGKPLPTCEQHRVKAATMMTHECVYEGMHSMQRMKPQVFGGLKNTKEVSCPENRKKTGKLRLSPRYHQNIKSTSSKGADSLVGITNLTTTERVSKLDARVGSKALIHIE